MNKKKTYRMLRLLLAGCLALMLTACSKDEAAPTIDSVWYNMVTQPIEQAPCAYPGQTLCIHGSGFKDLKLLIVNGTHIDLNNILVYVADNYITFKVPTDVNTSGDNIRVVTRWGMVDYNFAIRPADEQPTLYYNNDTKEIPFSTTTLVPGQTLTIRGSNLSGAKQVWLPLAFGDRIACEFDATKENTDEYIYVIVPEASNFATGHCEVELERTDETRGITYTEKVYSKETDFK